MRKWMGCVVVLAVIAAAGVAWADMKAFNAAVKVGDYKTAAAEAETTWAAWDKTKPDTAVVAREFGFAALIGGRYDLAKQFGQFLVDNGAKLSVPDDQPETSAVLYRVADFKATKSNDKLPALRAALTNRLKAPGIDMTSVVAWEALYVSDTAVGWDQASQDAAQAAAFYARDKGLLNRQRMAEVFAGSGAFIAGRGRVTQSKNNYYATMADLHDAIVADIEAASPSMQKQLWPLKWKAEAWALAMEAYLTSAYQQVGSNIDSSLKPRALVQPKYGQIPEDAILAGFPLCEGKFEGKEMRYPSSREYSGMVGSVIARLETGIDGKVNHVELLAAVPGDGFGAYVTETMSTWTFKPAKGVDTSRCRLQSKNYNYRVIFKID